MNYRKINTKKIANIGVVAGIYVVLTVALSSLSYGGVQFRVAEMLTLLCFYKKDYCLSVTLGCFISNMFSPMPVDMLIGTLATVVAVVPMYYIGKKATKNRLFKMVLASLCPVLSNALIVGAELKIFVGLPFVISALEVALGEIVCVSLLGVICFWNLEKNKQFMKLLEN